MPPPRDALRLAIFLHLISWFLLSLLMLSGCDNEAKKRNQDLGQLFDAFNERVVVCAETSAALGYVPDLCRKRISWP